jgi:hypothetical protein
VCMIGCAIAPAEHVYYFEGVAARVKGPGEDAGAIKGRIVTRVVQLTKLTGQLVANFP